jgi:hypothetical protein
LANDVDQLVVSVGWPNDSKKQDPWSNGPRGHGHVWWVLAEGWQWYWADGAADEAMVWSTVDGAMGGCFVMVKASNFACKWGGYLRYLLVGTFSTYSYCKSFDANREIAFFQLIKTHKIVKVLFSATKNSLNSCKHLRQT